MALRVHLESAFFPLVKLSNRGIAAPLRRSAARPTAPRFRLLPASSMSSLTSTSPAVIALPGFDGVEVVAAPGLLESDLRKAVDCALFKQWLKNLRSEKGILNYGRMNLTKIQVQGIDMFGARVGFLKFRADIVDNETKSKIPGIVFARGPAVAVLILLESRGQTYAVLTEQARVPVGRSILELPAGMLDDEQGDFVGTAVREVQEEIGIDLKLEDMINLTAFLDPSTGNGVFPSPGGCDEEITLFLYKGTVEQEMIDSLQGKETGLRDHGELISVRVVPYHQLWRATADAKTLCAVALYEMAKKDGILPS